MFFRPGGSTAGLGLELLPGGRSLYNNDCILSLGLPCHCLTGVVTLRIQRQ